MFRQPRPATQPPADKAQPALGTITLQSRASAGLWHVTKPQLCNRTREGVVNTICQVKYNGIDILTDNAARGSVVFCSDNHGWGIPLEVVSCGDVDFPDAWTVKPLKRMWWESTTDKYKGISTQDASDVLRDAQDEIIHLWIQLPDIPEGGEFHKIKKQYKTVAELARLVSKAMNDYMTSGPGADYAFGIDIWKGRQLYLIGLQRVAPTIYQPVFMFSGKPNQLCHVTPGTESAESAWEREGRRRAEREEARKSLKSQQDEQRKPPTMPLKSCLKKVSYSNQAQAAQVESLPADRYQQWDTAAPRKMTRRPQAPQVSRPPIAPAGHQRGPSMCPPFYTSYSCY